MFDKNNIYIYIYICIYKIFWLPVGCYGHGQGPGTAPYWPGPSRQVDADLRHKESVERLHRMQLRHLRWDQERHDTEFERTLYLDADCIEHTPANFVPVHRRLYMKLRPVEVLASAAYPSPAPVPAQPVAAHVPEVQEADHALPQVPEVQEDELLELLRSPDSAPLFQEAAPSPAPFVGNNIVVPESLLPGDDGADGQVFDSL